MLKASRSGTAPYENGMPENGMPQAALVSRQSPCRAGIRHLCLPDTCNIVLAYIQNGKGSSPNIAREHHPLAPTHVPRVGRDLINYAGEHAFISPQVRRAYTNLDPTEAACGRIKQKRWTVDANHFREMAGQSGHGLLRLTMCGTTCHNARPGRVSRWRCPSVYIPGFRMPNIHNRLVAEMIRTTFFLRGFISTMCIRHKWPERACQPRPPIELHCNGRLGQALPEEGADVDVGYTCWWRQRGMREKGPCWVGLRIHSNGMPRSDAKA